MLFHITSLVSTYPHQEKTHPTFHKPNMGSVPLSDPVRLAMLVTDEPLPSVVAKLGRFDNIFTSLLRAACESLDPPRTLESELDISAHDVVAGDPETTYPEPQTIDAVLITGSKYSAYADDDWIVRLTEYTRRLLDEGRVRVIGVCFGHQIVARALGARVARSPLGWELSVTRVELTEEGKRVFRAESLVSRRFPALQDGKERSIGCTPEKRKCTVVSLRLSTDLLM